MKKLDLKKLLTAGLAAMMTVTAIGVTALAANEEDEPVLDAVEEDNAPVVLEYLDTVLVVSNSDEEKLIIPLETTEKQLVSELHGNIAEIKDTNGSIVETVNLADSITVSENTSAKISIRYIVTGDEVCLREEASTSSSVKAYLYQGMIFTGDSILVSWGWVHGTVYDDLGYYAPDSIEGWSGYVYSQYLMYE